MKIHDLILRSSHTHIHVHMYRHTHTDDRINMQNEQTNNAETITSNLARFEERYKTKKKVILQCEGRYQKNTHMWYKPFAL